MNENNKILDDTQRVITNYTTGCLEMNLGYKFRTKEFLDVIFLYINSVDVKNPDILGANNKNTFVYEAQSAIRKVKEQVRLDLKDINFTIHGATSLSRFIPKAANRKIMEENNFAEVMDEIPDNAVDFGSGFLKVWKVGSKLKMKSIDPYYMIFDQYNFKDGIKIEKFKRTIRSIIDDEKYDLESRIKLKDKTEEANLDDMMVLYQSVQDMPDGTQRVSIVSVEERLVFYTYVTKKGSDKMIKYYKYDLEKRKGFPDALGIGYNERIFNKLVQSKVNRERMDKVMRIASTLPFQKQIDNEHDNMVGKEVVDLATGVIIGHKGNPIEPMNVGGITQANLIRSELNAIIQTIGNDLNVGEALQGNTLPSGTSGVLGNLLTENSSSVLKEFKKAYANFLDRVYTDSVIPYMLNAFDSNDNLKKYLTPNDYKLVQRGIKEYYVASSYIDSVINQVPFDRAVAEAEADQKIKKADGVIPGELLEQLREEMDGIRTYISGENISKAQAVAFLRELQAKYAANPGIFNDPFVLELIKKEAEYDAGMSSLEIDALLQEIPQQVQQPTNV